MNRVYLFTQSHSPWDDPRNTFSRNLTYKGRDEQCSLRIRPETAIPMACQRWCIVFYIHTFISRLPSISMPGINNHHENARKMLEHTILGI